MKSIGSITDSVENKHNSFELFGFDFVIDKSLNCWLLEVNMSPACSERAPWLTEMLDDMAEGLLNIIERKIIKIN
jgi:tubulin monoglycylase TTLL3/8